MDFISSTLLHISGPLFAILEDAPGGEAQAPNFMSQLLPFLMIGALAWFLLIAPERKRQKARMEMLGAVQKNDKVVTNGGLIGTVTKVEESQLTLRIADGVNVHVQRGAISNVLSAKTEAETESDS